MKKLSLRFGPATVRTRSAPAVPPGFDGFLRASTCRLVASCSRPWGSPRFGSHVGMSLWCAAPVVGMFDHLGFRRGQSLRTGVPAAGSPARACMHRSNRCAGLGAGCPARRPGPAGLLHLGHLMGVAAHRASGHALPRSPRSKARPDLKHVAVSHAMWTRTRERRNR
jgi:hypothetical protein